MMASAAVDLVVVAAAVVKFPLFVFPRYGLPLIRRVTPFYLYADGGGRRARL